MKKNAHIRFRNNALFCSNCGKTQAIPFPIDVDVMAGMAKGFEKSHKSCPKTWIQPEAPEALPLREAVAWWLGHGERGVSSETIVAATVGMCEPQFSRCHPLDPDDFRRCYLLLKAAPGLREHFPKLAKESAVWSRLVENWDKLTMMLEEAMSNKAKRSTEMYDFMKSLGC